jgi:antagonist of KipI
MALEIIKPGILTTVRDLGRFGFRSYGVNPTGVMDSFAARVANLLVGNDERAALLEAHFPAPEIRFRSNTILTVTGADFLPRLDGVPIGTWKTCIVEAGCILSFKEKRAGARCYIAVSGGLNVPEWLASRSTNLAAAAGGFRGRKLAAGDIIETSGREPGSFTPIAAARSMIPKYHDFPTVRITAGPEFERLDDRGKQALTDSTFIVSQRSDLMGFRLEGAILGLTGNSQFLSSATTAGTIQLPFSGEPVLLMSDHQTTGGYPRVGHVVTADIPLAGQLGPADRIAFHLVDIAEAHRLLFALEHDIAILKAACRLHYR